MATGKKKVIVYTDWIEQFKDLTDEEAGKLIKHFFAYVNDLDPKSDRLTELLFNPIKATLKRDLIAWESKQKINVENGKKGGRPKKKETQKNPKNPNGLLKTQNNPEKGVSVSVSVNDSNNINTNNVESIDFDVLLKFINDSFSRQFRLINDKAKKQFKVRLKNGYTKEDIKQCIVNLKSNTYHKENGYQYCTPEFISRQDTLDKYSSLKQQKENLSLQEQIIKNYKA